MSICFPRAVILKLEITASNATTTLWLSAEIVAEIVVGESRSVSMSDGEMEKMEDKTTESLELNSVMLRSPIACAREMLNETAGLSIAILGCKGGVVGGKCGDATDGTIGGIDGGTFPGSKVTDVFCVLRRVYAPSKTTPTNEAAMAIVMNCQSHES